MPRFFNFFDYLSFNDFFKRECTILIKMITYSHNYRVVFKLDNNRLYISCLRGRSREKIFINFNIFYNTDEKIVECFRIIFMPSTIFKSYFTTKNWLYFLPELLRISQIDYINIFIAVLFSLHIH